MNLKLNFNKNKDSELPPKMLSNQTESHIEVREDGSIHEVTTNSMTFSMNQSIEPKEQYNKFNCYTKTCMCCGNKLYNYNLPKNDPDIQLIQNRKKLEELFYMEFTPDDPNFVLMCPNCKCFTFWDDLSIDKQDREELKQFVSSDTYLTFLDHTKNDENCFKSWLGLYYCLFAIGYYDLGTIALWIATDFAVRFTPQDPNNTINLLETCLKYSWQMANETNGYYSYVYSIIALDCLMRLKDWETAGNLYNKIVESIEQSGGNSESFTPISSAYRYILAQQYDWNQSIVRDLYIDTE